MPSGLVVTEAPFRAHIPGQTKIRETLIHGYFGEPTSAPAVLRPRDGVSPLKIALEKVVQDTSGKISQDLVMECARFFCSKIGDFSPTALRPTTVAIAINGDPFNPFYRPLATNTGVGYPLGLVDKSRLKFFLGDVGEYSMDKRLEESFNGFWECKEEVYWVDILKDETRSLEKVSLCKTRLFSMGPLGFTIMMRRLLMPILSQLKKIGFKFGLMFDINPLGTEWHTLGQRIYSPDCNYICGDFGHYDYDILYEVLNGVKYIIRHFMGAWDQEDVARFDYGWDKITRSKHIVMQYEYDVKGGNPSGNFLTTFINMISNWLLHCCAFVVGCRERELDDPFERFWKGVFLAYFGDDSCGAVAKSYPWFNMKYLSETFALFGMTYTSSSKTEVYLEYMPFEDIDFLNRRFVLLDGCYRAQLPEDIIWEISQWTKHKNAHWAAHNALFCIMEHFHEYDRSTYLAALEKVDECCRRFGFPMVVDAWQKAQSIYHGSLTGVKKLF